MYLTRISSTWVGASQKLFGGGRRKRLEVYDADNDEWEADYVEDDEDDGDSADAEDLSKLSVAELKERLKAAGMPVGGKKADLIARLSQEEE